ncbi:MAG: Fatty acid resistance protein FarB [Chlamydiia bacterium]|nr:Fatty acid resistance protein FarB [Chlamydiia bacterium]MCH9615488.1 Fatty acid resistance protein FarB [Chlamydiia bacterium]MCH9629143.1 Fatty acid resistance protein FarB [Chlamydiia bacterium]
MKLVITTFCLCMGVLMQVLDYSIANVCIPYIAGDLAVPTDQGTYVITFFAVGNAIGLPLTGWIVKRYGQIRTMLGSLILFTLWSWICGVSNSLMMLVVSRFIQGFVAGPLIPLSQSLMLTVYPKEKKNLALAIWNTVALVGPIAGPITGGWIVYNYTWPWIFFINIPIGIISVIGIFVLLRDQESETEKLPVDWVGFLLLAIAVTSLQLILDKGQQWDWLRSPRIKVLIVTCVLAFSYFFIWEKTEKHPIFDLSLFRNRNFTMGTIYTAFSFMIIMGAIVMTPLWLQESMGYVAYWAGLAVAPMGYVPLLLMPLVPLLMNKTSLRNLIAVSFFFFAVGVLSFTTYTTAVSFGYISMTRLLFGTGILFWLGPLTAIAVSRIPDEKLHTATGIFHFWRILFGGIGASIFTTGLQRRTIFHHHNIIETVNDYRHKIPSFMQYLGEQGLDHEQSLAVMNDMVDKQAAVLAQCDVYWIAGWTLMAAVPLTFFFKKRPKTAPPIEVAAE